MAFTRYSPRLFDPTSAKSFKVSRTKIENFMKCPRCFYLDRRLGIAQPSGPPFTLNSAVDGLLKKEFDAHRAIGAKHPLMTRYGIEAVPYDHPSMNEWRENFVGIQYLHQETNLLIFGAIDDIWVGENGELHIVDYKATAKDGEVSLDADWQISYKRQAEIYQWLFRQNGFRVSDTAYFVYVNGKKDAHAFDGKLEFSVNLLPYEGSDGWVEETILKLKSCLMSEEIPSFTEGCDYCSYLLKNQKLSASLS